MAKPGKVKHWKHGWIPIDPYAKAIKAGATPDEAKDISLGASPRPTKTEARRLAAEQAKRHPQVADVIKAGTKIPGAKDKIAYPESAGGMPMFASGGPQETSPWSSMYALLGIGMVPGMSGLKMQFKPDFPGQTPEDWSAAHGIQLHNYTKRGEEGDILQPIDSPTVLKMGQKAQPDLLKKMQTDGGFTYDPRTQGLIEPGKASGFAVSVPGTETVVGTEDPSKNEYVDREEFAKAYADLVTKHKAVLDRGGVIGGWYSPDRNQFMLEVSQILDPKDRNKAIEVGRSRNQEAIFDLATGETISTGGTGDAPPIAAVPQSASGGMRSRALAMPQTFTNLQSAITPDEVAAAKFYTGPGFRPLNSALRFNNGQASLPVASRMHHLDDLLSKSTLSQDTTVYRGVLSTGWLDGAQAPGTVLEDRGYMSTAVHPDSSYGGDTKMVITVHKGHHAIDLNGNGLTHHAEEREILLARGTKLRVLSDVKTSSTRIIQAEAFQ